MAAIPLGLTSYRRRGARTPEVALVNMMVEKDVTNQVDGLVRYQRPGLSLFATIGTGPIRDIFRRFGALNSNYLGVSGTELYSVTSTGVGTLLGTIPGSDLVCTDAGPTRAIIVGGGNAYSTDGTTLVQVNMPDGRLVSSVVYINSYFILTIADSQLFYWIAPGDVDPDPLNFASFENSSDNIVRACRLFDEVWFFGQQTTEIFQLSGDLDAPFTPIAGRLYEKGCANRDSIAVLDNTIFWVGNDLMAYRADTSPARISDHSMEERLRDAGTDGLRAWAMQLDGHAVYCLRMGAIGTYAFDVENPNWAHWKTFGFETWQAHVGTQVDGTAVIAGDDTNGNLYQLDTTRSDDNGTIMERKLTGGIQLVGSPEKCKSISLRMAVGWEPSPSVEPLVQMRFSDDGGNIWSSWLEASLGMQGDYRHEVSWWQLGQITDPGRVFEFRCTDPTIFRVSFCRMNDASSSL